VHAHATFNSLAIFPATNCDPGGRAAVSLTVFVACSKGSGFAAQADSARATPRATAHSLVHTRHPILTSLSGRARGYVRARRWGVPLASVLRLGTSANTGRPGYGKTRAGGPASGSRASVPQQPHPRTGGEGKSPWVGSIHHAPVVSLRTAEGGRSPSGSTPPVQSRAEGKSFLDHRIGIPHPAIDPTQPVLHPGRRGSEDDSRRPLATRVKAPH